MFQLGGPDSQAAVEPFLYNLFCDPDIINFPGAFLARKAPRQIDLHHALESRGPALRGNRRRLADSPAHRAARPRARSKRCGRTFHARTIVAMRYWHPDTAEAIAALEKRALRRTGSAAALSALFFRHHPQQPEGMESPVQHAKTPVKLDRSFLRSSGLHRGNRRAHQQRARKSPKQPEEIQLVFSAHGLPMTLVEKGDPYPQHIEKTVQLVRELGAWPNPHVLCFQSRVGPQKWLQPSLTGTIESWRTAASSACW